jgi:hypothetical protein
MNIIFSILPVVPTMARPFAAVSTQSAVAQHSDLVGVSAGK